jgi:hypothetical protein
MIVTKPLTANRIILDLCGGTGAWSRPYADAGYDVRNITLPAQDVRWFEALTEPVYGVLAAVDCTHFAGSGAQYWKEKDSDGRTLEALGVLDACCRIVLIHHPVFWCIENPVGRLKRWLGPSIMYFNPCDYGDPYTKKTCLWGMFNKPVPNPVTPEKVCEQGSWVQKLGGKSERTKTLRSITPSGFAKAFFEANK